MTIAEQALSLAGLSWSVFPVGGADGKRPLVAWRDTSTTQPSDLYARHPQATGIGVDCGKSNLVVLDIDDPDQAEQWLATNGHVLPDTLVAGTPSGDERRRHLYFAADPDRPIRNSASKLAPGVDVRGEGGYVVAPPSPGYVWLTSGVRPAPVPEWLHAAIEAAAAKPKPTAAPTSGDTLPGDTSKADRWGQRILDAELSTLARAPEGTRNAALFESACNVFEAVKGDHIDEAYAWSELMVVADRIGLDADEIGKSLESAWDRTDARHPKEELRAPTVPTSVSGGTIAPPRVSAIPTSSGMTVLSLDDIDELPPPRWLLNRRLPEGMTVLYGKPGAGKAQPVDEPVLTPAGWRPIGELRPGDQVIGSSGQATRVVGVHPQGQKPAVRIVFSDGALSVCCPDHLWSVRKGDSGRWQTLEASELAYSGHHREKKWQIPLVAPVDYLPTTTPLPLDPYLLGALLGDGGLTARIGFSSVDEDVLNEVRGALPAGTRLIGRAGCDYGIVSPPGQPNPVMIALRLLGLFGLKSQDKHVPEEYLRASPSARLALLQGLMDTDGWIDGASSSTFSSSSPALAGAVQELAWSLGGVASEIRVRETKGLPAHRLSFRLPLNMTPFRLGRKADRYQPKFAPTRRIERVEPAEYTDMVCIQVQAADQLYVTRDFVVTHNTFVALDWCLTVAAYTGQRVLYFAGEGVSGVRDRTRAWRAVNSGRDVTTFSMVPQVPMFLVPESVDEFRQVVADQKPVLVIVDTLARALTGGDENSATDVGLLVRTLDELRLQHGTSSLILHHTNVAGERERGSGALRGAADCMWKATPDHSGGLTLSCDKLKDGEYPGESRHHFRTVGPSVVLHPLTSALISNDESPV